jgi:thiol-disulfide isomerase/thioredoxin
MIIKLFTQPTCGKCPAAKEIIKKLKEKQPELKYEEYDVTTVDGMAEGSFYMVMATPTILVCDDTGEVIKDFRGEAPSLTELGKALE